MSKLYLCCGISGAGKSTWIKNHLAAYDRHVSRDDIRFSLVKEDEGYFSKEKEVKREYINTINRHLQNGYNVFADATQLTVFSRNLILSQITQRPDEIACIYVKTPLEVALQRNNMREGRLKVPESVIRRMYDQLEIPKLEEGFDTIYTIEEGRLNSIKRKLK